MRYALYHNELSTFDAALPAFRPNPTAYVEAATLADVYRLTQHIDRPWFTNPAVTLCLRSTSIGDLIIDPDGQRHIVAPIGFQPQAHPPERAVVLKNLHTLIHARLVPPVWQTTLTNALALLKDEG